MLRKVRKSTRTIVVYPSQCRDSYRLLREDDDYNDKEEKFHNLVVFILAISFVIFAAPLSEDSLPTVP